MTDGQDERGTNAPDDATWAETGPLPAGAGQAGWQPAWPPPPNWGFPPGWEATAEPERSRPRRRTKVVATSAALALVCGLAGAGIGHLLWGSGSTVTTAAGHSTPSGRGNSGSGQPYGGGGSYPFGGSSGGSPFGSSPSGGSPFGSEPGSGSGSRVSDAAGGPAHVSAIAAKVDPGLVDVNSTFGYQSVGGAGTGIVLTSNGEVLTNNHVIDGATKISVTDLGNGRTYAARVVGYDPVHDMAVLQLSGASGLKTATIGHSAQATVGEPVVAIGNAGGVGGTPSAAGGKITGLNQSLIAADDLDGTSEHLQGMLEVNSDVQEGDSGGSLVDAAGQVLGMDTANAEEYSGQTQEIRGYAIPINRVLATASAIEAGHGSADVHVGATAFLGVLDLTQSSSVGSGRSSVRGAVLARVVSGGPAAKAGLTGGDVITSFNGQAVTSSVTLSRLMITEHPGDTVRLGWTSGSGQTHVASVTLASGPPA
jgi:S1-C subfamily serine protease